MGLWTTPSRNEHGVGQPAASRTLRAATRCPRRAGILDPSARPPPFGIAGTGRGTGLFQSEQGTGFRKEGKTHPQPIHRFVYGLTSAAIANSWHPPSESGQPTEELAANFVHGLSIPGFRGTDPIRSFRNNRQFCALYPRGGWGADSPPRGTALSAVGIRIDRLRPLQTLEEREHLAKGGPAFRAQDNLATPRQPAQFLGPNQWHPC